MDKRLPVALMTAVLLGGGSGGYLYLKQGGALHRPQALQVSQRNDALGLCLEGVLMTYDVHWALACTTQAGDDNGADCELPPDKVAVVDAWLNKAEKECMAQARGTR